MSGAGQLPEGLGGLPVWRSERGVHRPAGPWTPTVHAFLRHLARMGFEGAPKVVGTDDEGREILTYIEGEVLASGPGVAARGADTMAFVGPNRRVPGRDGTAGAALS